MCTEAWNSASCVELELVWHDYSKIMRAKMVEGETSKNPVVRSLYLAVLRNLNFSREQRTGFSNGRSDQVWVFC